MAETKTTKLEREYTIPLRSEWIRVPEYDRTARAIKAIKKFIAKHMKVTDRDPKLVKIDVYSNNELWFKGRRHPPSKVRVKATKEGEIVKVELLEMPARVKFLKAKHERIHKASPKKAEKKTEEKVEEKTEEQKKEEAEKEKSVAESNLKSAEQQVKAEKHMTKVDKAQHPQRMALKK